MMKNNKGFTLIELMVVVVIIGILVAVGLPSYSRYVVESYRSDAKGRLVSLESRLQRFYSVSGRTYSGAATSLGITDLKTDAIDTDQYNYKIIIPADGQSFTLTAEALEPQKSQDSACQTLTITNTGAKTPVACWTTI